jgi:hypothetical protein
MPSRGARPSFARSLTGAYYRRTKCGRGLSVDARFNSGIPAFVRSDRPRVLGFYHVTLLTRGSETFALDDAICRDWKPCGITTMIVATLPLSRTSLPTMLSSRPKSRCQRP